MRVRSHSRVHVGLALLTLVLTLTLTATAQLSSDLLPSYEGQNVAFVGLAGRPDVDRSSLEPLIVQKPGQPLTRENIDATIKNLESISKGPNASIKNVDFEILPESNGLRLVFVLQPALYVGMYQFPGSGRIPYSRLLQITNYQNQRPYSASDVQNAQRELLTFFRRTGYFLATVEPALKTDPAHGLVDVIFNINLNRRAHVGKINITGTTPEEEAQLKDALSSIMARLRGKSLRPGQTYTLARLNSATQYLQRELGGQGFLAAKVKLISADYEPETNHANITFHVTTGPKISIKTQGAHLWSWTKKSLIPMYQEHAISDELIREGQRDLLSYFQSKGYFDVKVETDSQKEGNRETVVYTITKGKRHKVEDVNIAGNHKFDDKELMPMVGVQKGRFFFNHGKYSQQLVSASTRKLENFYKAAGYGQAKVTSKVVNKGGDIAVTFFVDEGQLDVVDNLEIVGNNTVPASELAPKGLKLGVGKPYSQELVTSDRNAIMARYLTLGYPTATFRAVAKPSDSDPHHLNVTYTINEGPRVETSTIVTTGAAHTEQGLISHTLDIKEGQPVSANTMLSSEGKLYRLGIFDWASVDTRRPVTKQNQEEVVVKVHESRRNEITYGFGFEVISRGGSLPSGTVALPGLPPVGLPKDFTTSQKTFWGPRGSFQYVRKNVRGRAETFSIGGLAARLNQRASLNYTDPYIRDTNWASNFTASFEHNSENPIFTSRITDFGWQIQRPWKGEANTLMLRYNFRKTALTRLLIQDLVPVEDRSVRLSSVGGTFIHDTRDNVLDAHKGTYQSYELSINPKALGSSVNFVRLLGQSAYYRPLGAGVIWANSARIGLAQPFSGSHVPISEQFFSGGGSTLRGFPLNGAGPQRPVAICEAPCTDRINVPEGGNQLLILNTELRFPLFIMKNLGGAVFYDGGNVFRKIGFHNFWDNYTNNVGFGLRYATPVGPVRVDIGHNLDALPGIKSTQIFITLGQAF